MIAHPEATQAYSELKHELAKKLDVYDIEGYMDSNDAFIKEIEQWAIAWSKLCSCCRLLTSAGVRRSASEIDANQTGQTGLAGWQLQTVAETVRWESRVEQTDG